MRRNAVTWGAEITLATAISGAPLAQPRAIGAGRLSARLVNGRNALGDLRQSGALKLVFPRGTAALETVMVNTAGGITGGDRFSLEARAESGATLTLTTQAAERAYRAQPGPAGRMTARLGADPGARLNWLPQETILYEGCNFHRHFTADLAGDATLLYCEAVIFGRTAMGEALHAASFRDHVEIRRDGCPVYLDGMALTGDIAAELDRPGVAAGARAMASLVFAGPRAAAQLTPLRALVPTAGGVSLIAPDLLALRLLAADGFELRRSLLPLLDHLSSDTLPTCWRL